MQPGSNSGRSSQTRHGLEVGFSKPYQLAHLSWVFRCTKLQAGSQFLQDELQQAHAKKTLAPTQARFAIMANDSAQYARLAHPLSQKNFTC